MRDGTAVLGRSIREKSGRGWSRRAKLREDDNEPSWDDGKAALAGYQTFLTLEDAIRQIISQQEQAGCWKMTPALALELGIVLRPGRDLQRLHQMNEADAPAEKRDHETVRLQQYSSNCCAYLNGHARC